MKHAMSIRMENSTAALSKVIGLFRVQGLSIERMSVTANLDANTFDLEVSFEASGSVDLLRRQIERLVVVWEVSDIMAEVTSLAV